MEIKSTRETKTGLLWENLNNFPDKTDLDFGSLTAFAFYENIKENNSPNNVMLGGLLTGHMFAFCCALVGLVLLIQGKRIRTAPICVYFK